MSRRWESAWTPSRCAALGRTVHALSEIDGQGPHVRPCKDPFERPGLVFEYTLYHRQVELYLAQTGEVTIVRRDGAADMRPVAELRRWLDALRESLRWLDNGRDPWPPE